MKKIKLLLTIALCMLTISNVNAMTVKPTGDTEGKRGEEKTIYITLERSSSEAEVSAVEGTIDYDTDVLEFVSSELLMKDWTALSSNFDNGGTFSYSNITYNNLINTTNANIAKIVFKIKDDAEYGETDIIFEEGETGVVDGDSEAIEDVSYESHTLEVISEESSVTDGDDTLADNTNNEDNNITNNNTNTGVTNPGTGEGTITIAIIMTIISAIIVFAVLPNYNKKND